MAYFATVEALERFALSLGSRVGRDSGASSGSCFCRAFDVSPLGVRSGGSVSGMLVLRNKRRRAFGLRSLGRMCQAPEEMLEEGYQKVSVTHIV